MQIVLINAPWKPNHNRCGRWGGRTVSMSKNPPIYLLYAGAVVEERGHHATVIDAGAEEIGLEEVFDRVRLTQPDIAVIETNCASIEADLECARVVKRAGIPLVGLSGTMATTFHSKILNEQSEIDFCLHGEYDYTVASLCNDDWSKIDGISYRTSEGIYVQQKRVYIEDLDALPYPAYHLINRDLYDEIIIQNRPFVQSVESRSCPYNCTFCITHGMFGRKWRAMSPNRVVNEMEHWEHKGIREVFWDGETFTINKKRCKAICNLIVQRGLKIKWSCLARADTVTQDMLKRMANANCVQIRYGFESASQAVLDYVRKGYRVADIINASKWTQDAGILVHGAWMFVPPVETEESAYATMKLAEKTCDTAQFTVCTPYPGTEFYSMCERKGLLLTKDWSAYLASDQSVVKTDVDLRSLVGEAYKGFYGRPLYMAKTALREMRKGTLRKAIRVGAKILRGGFW